MRILLLLLTAAGALGWLVQHILFPTPPIGNGDPGDHRLHQLAADPVFRVLPSNARSPETVLKPARYRETPFQGAGATWDGPAVIVSFESSAPPRSVYEYYGEQAVAHGWTPYLSGALHITDRWRKTYSNGAQAYLGIYSPYPWEPAPGPRPYTLTGSISLPR